jgi:hypothetical protein
LKRGVFALAFVVADDERDRRLVRGRNIEMLLGELDVLRVRREPADNGLVVVEVRAAERGQRDHHREGDEPEEHAPDLGSEAAPRGERLAVARDLAEDRGREDGAPVPVYRGAPADSSLQRRPHAKKRERLVGARTARG